MTILEEFKVLNNYVQHKYSTDYSACKPLKLLELIQDISGHNLNIEFKNDNAYLRWVIHSNFTHKLKDRSLTVECHSYSGCTQYYTVRIIDYKTGIASERYLEVNRLRNIISVLDMILNIYLHQIRTDVEYTNRLREIDITKI